MTDLFLPCHPKDAVKVPFILETVAKHVPDVKRAFICSPERMNFSPALPTVFLEDREVLDIDPVALFQHRPWWIYQQYLKLFQPFTDDWYMVIDADRFFNRRIDLWQDGKPVMLLGTDQNHEPYFTFNRRMIGIGKTYAHSFLSECTLYSRALILEMLHDNGYDTPLEFINQSAAIIDRECYPAESELYGSWVWAEHRNLYTFRHLKNSLQGRYGSQGYTKQEIADKIKEAKDQDFDVFSLHSWEGVV